MIQFINVTKFYPPSTYALKDINLEIKEGEFLSIIGQSGAGKTTLIKLLIAEEKPTKGRIIVDDWDITNIKRREIPYLRRKIGVAFQDLKLLEKKNVFENVAFALEVCSYPFKKIKDITEQILKIVGLEKKKDRFPSQLSAGEKQKVAIARALVHRPKIFAADEPTGNLDVINTREILEILKRINELGTTVLLVTHNREVVNLLKKRVISLERGVIIGDHQKSRYII